MLRDLHAELGLPVKLIGTGERVRNVVQPPDDAARDAVESIDPGDIER